MKPNEAKAFLALARAVAALDTDVYDVFFAIHTEPDRLGLYVARRDNGMELVRCMGMRCNEADMAVMLRKVREIDAEWTQEALPLGGVERR